MNRVKEQLWNDNEFHSLQRSKTERHFKKKKTHQVPELFRYLKMMQLGVYLKTVSFLHNQRSSSCLKHIVQAINMFSPQEFLHELPLVLLSCHALHTAAQWLQALFSVCMGGCLRFLLPSASTNCFHWKSKWNLSNDFSIYSLKVCGPLWVSHLQCLSCEECISACL